MIPIFNMLLKGRKSEGPVTEQRPLAITPDGAAKVELTTAASPVVVSPTAPADITGELLWLNTTAGLEGVYFYDLTRAKWLEIALQKFSWGEDAADNQVLAVTGVNNAGLGTGYATLQDLTIVGIQAHARAGDATKTFDVRRNGSIIVASFSLIASHFANMNLDDDVVGGASDFIDVFAIAAGTVVRDVSVDVYFRRRAS